jgi:hypothetical protein
MQHWSKLDNHEGEHRPSKRLQHEAMCLGYGGDHPQLLVTGGIWGDEALSDAWMLDVQSGRWKEVRVSYLICVVSAIFTTYQQQTMI